MLKCSEDKAHQAYCLLRFVFIIAPIVAGLDKFFYLLTDWSQYIAPMALEMIRHHDRAFMVTIGIIEIAAGIGVYYRPKIFSYVVALWLLGIVVNLVMTGQYFDIALRDFGLMLSAFALGRLSHKYAAC